jgi:hypothetical protein
MPTLQTSAVARAEFDPDDPDTTAADLAIVEAEATAAAAATEMFADLVADHVAAGGLVCVSDVTTDTSLTATDDGAEVVVSVTAPAAGGMLAHAA